MSLAYYGQVQEADTMVGRILDALEASPDARDSTIVIFTADHGEMRLEHRHVEKMSHYEGSARVPMLVMGPGIKARQVETPVSLIDLFPTLLDVAGAQKPRYLEGRSLLPIWEGSDQNLVQEGSDYVISEFMGESNA